MKLIAGLVLGWMVSSSALAMEAEKIKVTVWKKGEAIAGNDFVAANEAVVDYLATLRRPTEGLKGIRYNCTVKGRLSQHSVYVDNRPWFANVITVYELRDCVEIQ